jgi:protein-tyrosine-phosphatase
MRIRKSSRMNPCAAVPFSMLLISSLSIAQPTDSHPWARSTTVVFVCEHGSVKSVIAAGHFNRLAAESGLPYHAVARGTNPDREIPRGVVEGLAADGLKVGGDRPARVSLKDVQDAAQTVTIATELRSSVAARATSLIEWNDVPAVSEDYTAAREAIVRHVTELLRQLIVKTR